MVWNYNESDSEEERHDRFRSERTNIPANAIGTGAVGVNKIERIRGDIGSRRKRPSPEVLHSRSGRSWELRGICSGCDYRVELCRCRNRHGPGESDKWLESVKRQIEEKQSRKRRNSGEERQKTKRRSRDRSRSRTRTGSTVSSTVKQHIDKNGLSKYDEKDSRSKHYERTHDESSKHSKEPENEKEEKKHKKKCKKKLKEKKKEESRKKSLKHKEDSHTSDRLITDDLDAKPRKEEKTATSEGIYGPKLPTVHKERDADKIRKDELRGEEAAAYGPALPAKDDDPAAYGPALPPRVDEPKPRVFGPSLDSSRAKHSSTSSSEVKPVSDDDGTASSQQHTSDEDADIGPLPEGSILTPSQLLLQHRARLLKVHMENKVEVIESKREEWMLELPDKHRTTIGAALGPRSFRTKEAPTVDPSWTDTPQEKANKLAMSQMQSGDKEKEELSRRIRRERDKHMKKLAEKSSKRSDKSLLQMHQDKLAKKKEAKSEGPQERRPFNRETDLGISRLTQAQKQTIYKKAAALDSRFSAGESKYL